MIDRRTLPVYAPGTRSEWIHASLLVPALLYRVMLIRGSDTDILLQAVRDLRRAGVSSPQRQARLLGLPPDLAEYLNMQAGLDTDETTTRHEVGWMVQDQLAGGVWPVVLRTDETAEVQYSETGWPRRIVQGSAGRPTYEPVRAVTSTTQRPAPPKAADIVWSLEVAGTRYAGAKIIGEAREVLVRVFVAADAAGEPVLIDPTTSQVDPDLTQRLSALASEDADLARWIAPAQGGRRTATGGIVALLRQLDAIGSSLRGRGIRDTVLLRDLRTAARFLLSNLLEEYLDRVRHLRHVSPVERARSLAATGLSEVPEFVPRVAADISGDGFLSKAADVILATVRDSDNGAITPDPAVLLRVALLVEDIEDHLSTDVTPTEAQDVAERLIQLLHTLAEPLADLEAI